MSTEIPESIMADLHTVSAKNMLTKALKNGWNLPENLFQALPGFIFKELNEPGTTKRNKFAAAKLLLEMSRFNLAAGQLAHNVMNGSGGAVTVNVAGENVAVVNQAMAEKNEIIDVINELTKLGLMGGGDSENAEDAIRPAQADLETTGVSR